MFKTNSPIQKIVLLEPKEEGINVFSFCKIPRLGVPILATLLRDRGYHVKVFIEKMAPIKWREVYQADLVGISVVTNTAFPCYRLAQKIRARGIPVVLGGPHPTFEPDEALQYGDYVLRGEGEESLLKLIATLNRAEDLREVNGLSFWDKGRPIHNPSSAFCPNIDITPDFSLIHGAEKFYNRRFHFDVSSLEVLTTRGCPFGCKFCSVIKMSGRKMRERNIYQVADEIEHLVTTYRQKKMFIVDDNFTANRERAKKLLRLIISRKIPVKMSAQVRVETANDLELVQLMKLAGIHMVEIGLESVNPETLKVYNKRQQVDEMKKAVQVFTKVGIVVHGMFIIGSDCDTPATVAATIKFSQELGLAAIQLMPLGPLPGTELTAQMQRENRVISRDWSVYDGNKVVLFPRRMRPSVNQRSIFWGYKKFYSFWRFWTYVKKRQWGYAGISIFGYFASRKAERQNIPYIRYLEKVEQGKYRSTAAGEEIIDPVQHETEEGIIDNRFQDRLARLFGGEITLLPQQNGAHLFPSSRLLPRRLKIRFFTTYNRKNFSKRLRKALRLSPRPLVLDFSEVKITDPNFWHKIYDAIKPLGHRVRLRVRSGTLSLWDKLCWENLRKLTIVES